MDHQQLIEALSSNDLFSDLSKEDLKEVADKVKLRQFFPEEVIVWQGQPSTALFLVINGIVVIKRIWLERESVLAYLMPGSTFGEVGILENEPRSANVVAMTEVDVIVIQREDFLDLLKRRAVVAIQLARILGRYLLRANRRLSQESNNGRMILILSTGDRLGTTSFGNLLAEQLAANRADNTVYLEYPNSRHLMRDFTHNKNAGVYHHEAGYDILLPVADAMLPLGTRAALLLEKIQNTYNNAVIKVAGDMDEVVETFLEQANLVILMGPPTPEGLQEMDQLQRRIRQSIRQEETGVFTILIRSKPEYAQLDGLDYADGDIPFLDQFPSFELPRRLNPFVPAALQSVIDLCLERLDRTHSVGIFIPTTSDANHPVNTQQIRDNTMAFMAERFGGATWKPAQGVWLSEKLGLIGEEIYIVQSYTTRQYLHQYLDEIIIYIKTLKRELRQEAMALEVNKKLTLV